MIDTSDLRKGIKLKIDGQPHVVTDFSFMKPGKGQAVYRCKLKNMITGNTFDKSWRSGDKMEKADLHTGSLIYSYQEGDPGHLHPVPRQRELEIRDGRL